MEMFKKNNKTLKHFSPDFAGRSAQHASRESGTKCDCAERATEQIISGAFIAALQHSLCMSFQDSSAPSHERSCIILWACPIYSNPLESTWLQTSFRTSTIVMTNAEHNPKSLRQMQMNMEQGSSPESRFLIRPMLCQVPENFWGT